MRLQRRGLIAPDSLGVGIETEDCAVQNSAGHTSPWLFALGPLTRPSWWEVVAVPEINAQIDRLVHDISEGKAIEHVFLVGFPRSGTTLLENVLASHPKIVTMPWALVPTKYSWRVAR